MDSHDGQSSLAAGQTKEKVVVRPSPTTSGTAAVLSVVQEQADWVTAPRGTLSFCCRPCQTTHDRTFLCSEALITGGLQKKRREEDKSHLSGQVEGFCDCNRTERDGTYKDKSWCDAALGHFICTPAPGS